MNELQAQPEALEAAAKPARPRLFILRSPFSVFHFLAGRRNEKRRTENGERKAPATPTRRAWVRLIGRVLVSGILLGWLLFKLRGGLLERLSLLTPALVVGAWVYYATCQFLSSYRWQLLLTAQGIHVPILRLFSFYMIGMFFHNLMPGAVGGDVIKTYYLYQETRQGKYSVASVFLDRFSGLLGLSSLSILALPFAFGRVDSALVLAAVGATALFLLGVMLLLWWPPLAQRIMRLLGWLFPVKLAHLLQQAYSALGSYRHHRKALLAAVLLSVLIQTLYAFFYAYISWGLEVPINVLYFILFLPMITVLIMVPITFGGLGVREALMIMLFGSVGVPAADILSVSLVAYFLNALLSLAGGLLFMLRQPAPLPQEA